MNQLDLLGISRIANMLMSIKFAKYYELTGKAVVLTIFTDSMEMYQSRLKEELEKKGEYTELRAAVDFEGTLVQQDIENFIELGYRDRKRVHNLKYFTWVEQQGKTFEEIQSQWYDRDYWTNFQKQIPEIDGLIDEFNAKVGLI